jgi:hypothetical protein
LQLTNAIAAINKSFFIRFIFKISSKYSVKDIAAHKQILIANCWAIHTA